MQLLIYNHAISNKIKIPVCNGTQFMENKSAHISCSAANGINLFLNLFVKLMFKLTRHRAFSVSKSQ